MKPDTLRNKIIIIWEPYLMNGVGNTKEQRAWQMGLIECGKEI